MQDLSRRSLLTLTGMAAVAGGAARLGGAAPLTDTEQANVKVVTDFCAAWPKHDVEVLLPYLADNISYRVTETTPAIVGRTTFHDRIKDILQRTASIEFAVVETLAKGPIVLNERHDTLVSPQRTRRYHVVGMFFLAGGRIVEWTDYVISQS